MPRKRLTGGRAVRSFAVGQHTAGDKTAQGASLIRALRNRCRCAVRGAAQARNVRREAEETGGACGRVEHRLEPGIVREGHKKTAVVTINHLPRGARCSWHRKVPLSTTESG